MSRFIIFLIRLYQKYISPFFPKSCRFTPTCSEYAAQAFKKFNFFKAFYLSVRRILKCNPFGPSGFDPIP